LIEVVYIGFREFALDKWTKTLVLIDDCGNKWNCTLFFLSISYRHRKIAGEWKQMIAACRICEAAQIKLGALMVGKNEIVYLEFYREIGFYGGFFFFFLKNGF